MTQQFGATPTRSGYVWKQIDKSTRFVLWFNIALAVVTVGVAVVLRGYVWNCWNGPFSATLADVTAVTRAGMVEKWFVRVPIDGRDLDRMVYHISGGDDHKNDYYNFLHLADGRLLVVKMNKEDVPTEVVGAISSTDDGDTQKAIGAISGKIDGTVLPVKLEAGDYRSGAYVTGALVGLSLLFALYQIWSCVRCLRDPARHSFARQLATFGPIDEIALAVDAEVQAGGQKTGKVLTTTSWLIQEGLMSPKAVFLGDVIWAYKREVVQKAYGVVTTARTFSTVLHERSRKKTEIVLKKEQVEMLLKDIGARVPWAIIGYDAKLAAIWKKSPAEFIAAVDGRKQQVMASPPEGGASPPAAG